MTPNTSVHGLMAEFHTPQELVTAARRAREAGYRHMDAYSPFPIEELAEALHFHDRRVPLLVLVGGIVGAITAMALQYGTAVFIYPMNIGGRPDFSWPAFVVPTFELTILFAAGAAVVGMLGLNGFPAPYHPVFNAPRFALASRDRFFLCIEARDAKFDGQATRAFLESLGPREVVEVEE